MPRRCTSRIHRQSSSYDGATLSRTNAVVGRSYSGVIRRQLVHSRSSGRVVTVTPLVWSNTNQRLLPVLFILVYCCSGLSSHSLVFTTAFYIPVSLPWSFSTTSFLLCSAPNQPTTQRWMTSSDDCSQQTDAEHASPLTPHTGAAGQPRDKDDDTSWFPASTSGMERLVSAFRINSNTTGGTRQQPQPHSRLGWLRHRGGGSDSDITTSLHSSTTRTNVESDTIALNTTVPPTSVTHESAQSQRCNSEESSTASVHSTNCTTPASSVVATHASVHLQLTDPALAATAQTKRESDLTGDTSDIAPSTNTTVATDVVVDTAATEPSDPTPKTITVHTFHDSINGVTWKALNTAKRKFHAYLHYSGAISEGTHAQIETVRHVFEVTPTSEATTAVNKEGKALHQEGDAAKPATIDLEDMRNEWRQLWRSGRLLTDRTELVAVYPSDNDMKLQPQTNTNNDALVISSSKPEVVRKRGGFADLLQLYTDRVLAILQDEREDALQTQLRTPKNGTMVNCDLLQWLQASYGRPETAALMYENFSTLPENEQLVKYKHFLEWFRSQFPYFYDRCDTCGASIKEDTAAKAAARAVLNDDANTIIDEEVSSNPPESNHDLANKGDDDDDELDDDSNHRTFVGYTYPNTIELQGKASRTELYQCHVCKSFTRFPRFNSAAHVIEKRRGRCGEYSMLLFRLLRALNHECRWVVDWADHVWAEVLLTPASSLASPTKSHRRWVHLDPCEAAVDENFLYQDWGKKQTFILGFYLPVKSSSHLMRATTNGGSQSTTSVPLIEDITQCYTREPWSDVCDRREESEEQVESSISKAIGDLESKLV